MYIAITHLEDSGDIAARAEAAHRTQSEAQGYRWSMLLRGADDASVWTAISMWLAPEAAHAWREANTVPAPTDGYDVTTARGSMTPAAAIALVDWQVPSAEIDRFTARWNATYHAIEDVIGSRLLQNLESPGSYVGLHAVTDISRLDRDVLSARLTDSDGLALAPTDVRCFEVVLLTEAP